MRFFGTREIIAIHTRKLLQRRYNAIISKCMDFGKQLAYTSYGYSPWMEDWCLMVYIIGFVRHTAWELDRS